MNRCSALLVASTLPMSASATGVAFGQGLAGVWIALIVVAIGVLVLSIYLTNRFAQKHARNWYWIVWVGVFLFAVNFIFYTNW